MAIDAHTPNRREPLVREHMESEDGDRLVCERAYFDAATIARQLGVGL
jgi:hypothetical protein